METLFKWQELLGAVIGASAPFLLWWFAEEQRKRRERTEYLHYLERMLVDQINTLLDVRGTVDFFAHKRMPHLIANIKTTPLGTYSVDHAFFPLFSARALNEEVHRMSSGSGYIDNKIGQAYKLSKDLPLIVEDLRHQLAQSIQLNKEIALSKVNNADAQKVNYVENMEEFRRVVQKDMLETNIPAFLNVLVETRVAVNELNRIGLFKWRWRYDPRYRFFWTREAYQEARKNSYDYMTKVFNPKNAVALAEIEKIRLEQKGEDK